MPAVSIPLTVHPPAGDRMHAMNRRTQLLTGAAVALALTSAAVGSTSTSGAPALNGLGFRGNTHVLASAHFSQVVIPTSWAAIEPGPGVFSTRAITRLQLAIDAARAAGMQPVLDPGIQYPPRWIFAVGGGTRFVDQYGRAFTGSAGSGDNVANGVTNAGVRTQLGAYVRLLGTHLRGLAAVRLGGLADGELRYPSGARGAKPNAFWFYDASSQASLPIAIRGWRPGHGTARQATAFLQAYNGALANYGVWLEHTAGIAFPVSTKLELLLPGWGQRPGSTAIAARALLTRSPDEINQGLDWVDLVRRLPATGRVVAYSTYADATQGTASNPNPATYIHGLLRPGILEAGESTGNGRTSAAGEQLMFREARQWHWYAATWYFGGQPQTPGQVAGVWSGVLSLTG